MYRTSEKREGDVVTKNYTFTVFEGSFVTSMAKLLDSAVIPVIVVASAITICFIGKQIKEYEMSQPSKPEYYMSPIERCMRGPVSNDWCREAYKQDTERLKQLSDELLRREVEGAKKKQEEDARRVLDKGAELAKLPLCPRVDGWSRVYVALAASS